MSSLPQRRLDRYEIVDEIGRGAMGTVYLAQDALIGRLVAIKSFHAVNELSSERLVELRRHSIREAQAAGILSHPHIVTIHDVVEGGDELPMIAMEYVRGTNLREMLRPRRPLPLDFVTRVVCQVAAALDYAHSRGVIHGDVKPANILISGDEQAKLTDFGIASLEGAEATGSRKFLGTPHYVAPEQVLGQETDHRADLFSLGVVLYEMLFGQPPFRGDSAAEIIHRVAHEPFAPPSEADEARRSPELEAILRTALAKDPRNRYQSGAELAAAVQVVLASPPPPRQPEPESSVAATQDLTQLLPVRPAAAEDREEPADEPPAGEAAGETAPTATATAEPATEAEPDPADADLSVRPGDPKVPSSWTWKKVDEGASRPAAPWQEISLRRVGLAAGAALLALAMVTAFLLARAGTGVDYPGDPEAHRLRTQFVPLLKEGRGMLRAGKPQAAVALFEQAEEMAPELEGISRWREIATREAAEVSDYRSLEREIRDLLAQADAARAAGNRRQAAEIARRVLRLDPERVAARELLGRAAEPRAPARRAPEPPPAEAVASNPAASAVPLPVAPTPTPPAAAPDAPATLRIDFFSHLPRGVLTIYAGDEQVLLRPFRFVKKRGLFRRKGISGRFETRLELPTTPTTLRIVIALQGHKTQVTLLSTELAAGQRQVLRIAVSPAGEAAIDLS